MRMAKCRDSVQLSTKVGLVDFKRGTSYDLDLYGLSPGLIRAYFIDPELAPPPVQTRDIGGGKGDK